MHIEPTFFVPRACRAVATLGLAASLAACVVADPGTLSPPPEAKPAPAEKTHTKDDGSSASDTVHRPSASASNDDLPLLPGIGLEGGEVVSGAAHLTIPPGALVDRTSVWVKQIESPLLAAEVVGNTAYAFNPRGTTLDVPARIAIELGADALPCIALVLVQWDGELDAAALPRWTPVRGASWHVGRGPQPKALSGTIDRLGVYAVECRRWSSYPSPHPSIEVGPG